MPFPIFPGIRYDPREPLPPDVNAGHINAHYKLPEYEGQKPGVLPPRIPHGHVNSPQLLPEGGRGAPKVKYHDQQLREEGFLPPQSTSVKVQIIHDTAKFIVTQLFKNESHDIKQGIYQFPLPFDVTVTGFNCRIGPNKIIRGEVKAKEDARHDFNEARRQGRAGGLMEQQTPEIFTITLANIPSRTKMQAELCFVCFLKQRVVADHQVFTLTLPTFIAPRYGDVPPGVRMPTRDSHLLSLSIDILTVEDLITVKSETHAIEYNRSTGATPCQTWDDFIASNDNNVVNSKAATVELKGRPTSLDKDIVITIDTALSDDSDAPQACLETHPTLENHQALMLAIPPELMTAAAKSSNKGEIIFLADCSGSMRDKIESLKSAMMFFINGIPMNRPFNIWRFGSDYTALWSKSKPLNKSSREKAMAYVRKEFASDMGGTEILSALEAICNSSKSLGAMDIIVLTDGEVWYPEKTVDFVRSKWETSKGLIRFFSLGIGRAVSHELVEGIAKAGGGYAEVITSVSGGGWEDRVVAVLKAAITGHIGSLSMKLEWQKEDKQRTCPEFKQSPNDISTISPFLRNRIFLLFDSGKQSPALKHVILQAEEPNGDTITKTLSPKRLRQPDTLLHKLAARALLGDIERGESWLHKDQNAYTYDSMIKAEAIRLGCKWSLVSKWTSVYAVEEETTVPDEAMEMEINITVAADDLGDTLLLPRGGQAAAHLASGLLRSRGYIGQSDTKSDSSELSIGTCSAGQSVTGENSDGEADISARRMSSTEYFAIPPFRLNDNVRGSGMDEQCTHDEQQYTAQSQTPSLDESHQPPRQSLNRGTSHVGSFDSSQGRRGELNAEASSTAGRVTWRSRVSNLQFLQGFRERSSNIRHLRYERGSQESEVEEADMIINMAPRSFPAEKAITMSSDAHQPPSKRGYNGFGSSRGGRGFTPERANASSTMSGSRLRRFTYIPVPVIPSSSNPAFNRPAPLMVGADTDSVCRGRLRHKQIGATFSSMAPSATDDNSNDDPDDSLTSGPVPWRSLVSNGQTCVPSSSQQNNYIPTLGPDISSYWHEEPPHLTEFASERYTSAPIFNPPASTSLMRNVNQSGKTPDEVAAEKFIGRLLLKQTYDGRFSFSEDENIKATFGLPFLLLVISLRGKLNDFDSVLAVAIVALLEEQFQSCRDLWVLIVRKAVEYITRCDLGPILEELQQEARKSVKSMGSVMQELKQVDSASETAVTELEKAPISDEGIVPQLDQKEIRRSVKSAGSGVKEPEPVELALKTGSKSEKAPISEKEIAPQLEQQETESKNRWRLLKGSVKGMLSLNKRRQDSPR